MPKSTKLWTFIYLISVIALAGLGMYGCSLDNPGMPQWDIPVILPLSTQIYDMESLITDSSSFSEKGVGVFLDTTQQELFFVYQDTIPWNSLPDSVLRFTQEEPENFSVTLDTITINYQENEKSELAVERIFPGLDLPGTYPIAELFIPPQARQVGGIKYDSIESVHIVSENGGRLAIQIENNLGVNWDSLKIDILVAEPEIEEDSLLGSADFYDLQNNQQQISYMDISGKTIRDSLLVFVNGWGGDQGNVTFVEDNGLSFDIWIDSLRSDNVVAVLEKQDPVEEVLEFELEQEDWITNAQIETGAIVLQIENRLDVNDSVFVRFPALTDAEGNQVTKGINLERAYDNGEPWLYQERITLDGFTINMDLPDPLEDDAYQVLKAYTTSVITSSGTEDDGITPRKTRLSTQDSLIVTYYTEELVFTSITAVAKAKEIDIEEFTQEVDIWETQPNLQNDLYDFLGLEDVSINVNLNNDLEYPILLDLEFTALNSSLEAPDNSNVLNVRRWIRPYQSQIQIDSVQRLINMLPDTISISGKAYMGRDYITPESGFDKYEPHTIGRGDGLSGIVEIVSPLRISVSDTTTIRPVVEKFGEKFDNPLESITLSARVKNTMPLGGRLFILAGTFANETYAKAGLTWENHEEYALTSPILLIPTDSETDTIYSISAVIDKEHLNIFENENVFIRQIVRLFPTDGVVEAKIDDYLQVSVSAEVLYHVGGDE